MSSTASTTSETPAPPATDHASEEVAISVSGVGKRYHLWKSPSSRLNYSFLSQLHRTLRTVVERDTPLLASLARRRESLGKDFFALQGVSFTIKKGESVALIGRNGSGKSTLLQIIVNTLRPTSGEVDVNGRIAAMLELGSGFNPEFSGRENIGLNAMILGLSPAEIKERMEAIVEFADLGVFIDQPVKSYSSGMVVRLGFAVLTQIDPEILIIDEALAVGDFLFQQKCFDTIRRFKERGCTLVFVSHAMSTVLELCERALLLDSGHLAFDGPTEDAVNLYEASALRSRFQTGERPLQITAPVRAREQPADRPNGTIAASISLAPAEPAAPEPPVDPPPGTSTASKDGAPPHEAAAVPPAAPEPAPTLRDEPLEIQTEPALGSITSDGASLQYVRVHGSDGTERDYITSEEEMTLVIGILCHRRLQDPHVGFKIRDRLGRIFFETSSLCMRERIGVVEAGRVLVSKFSFALPAAPGEYSVTVGFSDGAVGAAEYAEVLLFQHGAKTFQVYKNPRSIIWSGLVNLSPQGEFTKEAPPSEETEAAVAAHGNSFAGGSPVS